MRNAFIGYTYQHQVTLLLLSIMDVERSILKLQIEAHTPDHFDDLILIDKTETYQLQIKDFDNIHLDDIKVEFDEILINGKSHKLSKNQNILFFKKIDITPKEKFLNFRSQRISKNLSIVSLSRIEADKEIDNLYHDNPQRQNEIDSFFHSILDNRIWEISVESLPRIKIFLTQLQEPSIQISHQLLEFDNLLLIEGKPGVGKSHFVNTLIKEYDNNIVYRFWIGSQDSDSKDRLQFVYFLRDLNAKIFYDQKQRTVEELLEKIKNENKTLIVDGLDHVENYNKPDFRQFVDFIDKAKEYFTIIVLSRPLVNAPAWKKQILENWNKDQTEKVLKELFFISAYSIIDKIYKISDGYPIIVTFLAEHFKLYHTVPALNDVKSIDEYYERIIDNEKGKESLSIFLCFSSYLMESEIELYIGEEKAYVIEFINEHPYLFDRKLNRIALLHDSFNTFLRKQIDIKSKSKKVAGIVCDSILRLEKRFMSRVSFFQLSPEQKKKIIRKYSDINIFEQIMKDCIDPEAVVSFYNQIRVLLGEMAPNDLTINNYYDLSLIYNLTLRESEHVAGQHDFNYTYVQCLIANGIAADDITSSANLFAMYYYVHTKNSTLLLNMAAKNHQDTSRFHKELEYEIFKEEKYIKKHDKIFDKRIIDKALKDGEHFRERLITIIENLYIHKSKVKGYEVLLSSFELYLNNEKGEALYQIETFLKKYNTSDYYPSLILSEVYKNLISYGYKLENGTNEYDDCTLQEFINIHRSSGSFDLTTTIHNYIRLAVHQKRKTDIKSIGSFWAKYFNRKDYTLYGLPVALKTLETGGMVPLKDCIDLINEVQQISEKGYRNLLAVFIEQYPSSRIIPFIEKHFDGKVLHVAWFKLPAKYINKFSDSIFNHEKNELVSYHQRFSIPLEEIENVLQSNRASQLESFLKIFKTTISFKKEQRKSVAKFSTSALAFEEQQEEKSYRDYSQTSQQRFESGILKLEDLPFIKKNKIKSFELAAFSDGNYTSLPDKEIFKNYEAADLTRNMKKILYYSLTSRSKDASYYYYLFYHPGNFLEMIKKYRDEKELMQAVKSFEKFMNLSMFDFKLKNN